jgi:hypothetical protein
MSTKPDEKSMCAAANVACPQRLTCIVIGQYNVTNGINSMFNIAAKNEFILVISIIQFVENLTLNYRHLSMDQPPVWPDVLILSVV